MYCNIADTIWLAMNGTGHKWLRLEKMLVRERVTVTASVLSAVVRHQQDYMLLVALKLVPPVLLVHPRSRDIPCNRYTKTRACHVVYT